MNRWFPVLLAIAVVAAAFLWPDVFSFSKPKESRPTVSEWTKGSSDPGIAGGSLDEHESKGGHMLSTHVGRTQDQLAARLRSDRSLGAASTFTSRDEAERAVSRVFASNKVRFNRWIESGAVGRLVLDAAWQGGIVMRRGARAAAQGRGVRLVLQGDGSGQFFILTGYPTF